MNDHNKPMQEITLDGKRIQFKTYMNPGTPQHLRMVAENELRTNKTEGDIII